MRVSEAAPYVIGVWSGAASGCSEDVASQAAGDLVARQGSRIVLDLGGLGTAADPVVQSIANLIGEAQRLGREVWLVGCAEALFCRLQRLGVSGGVSHAGSLAAATEGRSGRPDSSVHLHLRSQAEYLSRLRGVVSELSRRIGLGDGPELQVKMAVTEAAANAICHGSPEGARNHVQVSFHVAADALIVDVEDQGPGFDPSAVRRVAAAELSDHGYGLEMMRRSMDRVEFFHNERGMLVRMAKYLRPTGVQQVQ